MIIALIRIYFYGFGVLIAAMGAWELTQFLITNYPDSPFAGIIGLLSLISIPASSGLVIYLLSLILERKIKFIDEENTGISFGKIYYELGFINCILGLVLLSVVRMSVFEINFILYVVNFTYILRVLDKYSIKNS